MSGSSAARPGDGASNTSAERPGNGYTNNSRRIDFDGDYGKTYDKRIRNGIPCYESMLKVATTFLRMQALPSTKVLVTVPGWGEELAGFCLAQPEATFTLVEPSEVMLSTCKGRCEKDGTIGRMTLLQEPFTGETAKGEAFGAVICLNVLHCVPEDEQAPILKSAAECVAAGGVLLLAGHSEPAWAAGARKHGLRTRAAWQRLVDRSLVTWAQFQDIDDRLSGPMWSIDEAMVLSTLADAGCTDTVRLFQALFAIMWASRRPLPDVAEGAASAS